MLQNDLLKSIDYIKNEYESNFQYVLISLYRGHNIPVKMVPVAGNSASSADISPFRDIPRDIPMSRHRIQPLKMHNNSSSLLRYLFVFFPAYIPTMLSPPFCRFSAMSPGENMIKENNIFKVKIIPRYMAAPIESVRFSLS